MRRADLLAIAKTSFFLAARFLMYARDIGKTHLNQCFPNYTTRGARL